MLPEPLLSIYQQYKQDTNFVASWLASTAKVCGYPADLISPDASSTPQPKVKSARSKGKARKTGSKKGGASSGPSKYIIPLVNFVPLANHISQYKPLVSVPDAFATTINRLIDLRRGFAERMEEHGMNRDPKKDGNHNFFVGVLEAVRDSLKPRMSSKATETGIPSKDTKDKNKFAGLWVYEPSQAFLDAPAVERPQPGAGDGVIYEAEPQTSTDDTLFTFCLLMTDLHKIREQVKWMWSNHRTGMFDLATAAVATNTAVEFGHGLIDELEPLFKTVEHGALNLVTQFYCMLCLYKGLKEEDVMGNLDSPTEWFKYDHYDIADESFIMTYRLLHLLPHSIDPKTLPSIREGTLAPYNPNSNRESKSGKEKFLEDKSLIIEVFTELMTIIRLVPEYPACDELLRAIKEIDKNPKEPVPFWAVFAAQIFLDIQHTLRGSALKSVETMFNQLDSMRKDLEAHLEFHGSHRNDNWPASNDRLLAEKIKQIQWLLDDPLYRARSRLPHFRREPGPPKLHRLLLYSPVISGLILFRFRYEVYDIGIAVANAWGSIVSMGHLYNALQAENFLSPGRSWLDMRLAMTLLGDSSFWVGEGAFIRPSNPSEYFRRFCLQQGITAAAFGDPSKRRGKLNLNSRAGPRKIKDALAAVTALFAKRYCNSYSGQVDWTPEYVEDILAHSGSELTGMDDSSLVIESIDDPAKLREKRARAENKAKGKEKATATKIPAAELVTALVTCLQAESVEVAFPYLVLHRMAWRFLHIVQEECDPLLRQMYGPGYLGPEHRLPWVIGWIFMAASGSDGGPPDLTLLRLAGEALDECLSPEMGNGSIAINIARYMGFDIVLGEEEDDEDDIDEVERFMRSMVVGMNVVKR
ncbi:hypothetical protein V8F20_009560 [Naviculisporaceae sp. PSN 640]